jgi:hypothetical protein
MPCREESSSFLKKSTKKLVFPGARGAAARTSYNQSFLVLFFKKERFRP